MLRVKPSGTGLNIKLLQELLYMLLARHLSIQ
jgi:hypothetical protein